MKKLIDVYPYRIVKNEVEFLIFRRSSKKIYAGQWRMVGGKVKSDESSWQAGLRELNEETGLTPGLFWSVPSVNQFYEHKTDTVHTIPAFAAQLTAEVNVILDEEHTEFKWISAIDVDHYIKWPEQRRLIRLIEQLSVKKNNEILPEWIIEI